MTPNKSLQPTPVGVVSSADAGHVVDPAWLSNIGSLGQYIMRILALTVLVGILLSGCSREAVPMGGEGVQRIGQADEIEKQRRRAEGWDYLETVGTPFDGAQSTAFLQSDTARSITAVAFDGKQQVKKRFPQTDHVYLLVNMGHADKTYALVFRRPKPAQPDAAPGPPAAAAVRESSENMSTNLQSEAPASGGGR